MTLTKIHPATGARLKRDTRPFTVRYRDLERVVALPGWYPAKRGGESLHVGDDMAVVDTALAELKAESQGVLKPAEIRTIRLRLKLSQRKASELLGGGPRAFQKYESGEVLVSRSMTQLLRLLERDPRRLDELKQLSAA
ncbi:MAG TPA: type II toxin-antitoxin system MqsA family antitoxin [Rhizomicrobium sp.]|jgi:HTH-type transcriptional regulator/antitoxin MqsA|nr:type II toxin-antitoxin system MqsA family antitoxin [Rhizomicrobium sp.]